MDGRRVGGTEKKAKREWQQSSGGKRDSDGEKSRSPREDEISSSGWVVETRTVVVAATTEISVFVDDGSIVSPPPCRPAFFSSFPRKIVEEDDGRFAPSALLPPPRV